MSSLLVQTTKPFNFMRRMTPVTASGILQPQKCFSGDFKCDRALYTNQWINHVPNVESLWSILKKNVMLHENDFCNAPPKAERVGRNIPFYFFLKGISFPCIFAGFVLQNLTILFCVVDTATKHFHVSQNEGPPLWVFRDPKLIWDSEFQALK